MKYEKFQNHVNDRHALATVYDNSTGPSNNINLKGKPTKKKLRIGQ